MDLSALIALLASGIVRRGPRRFYATSSSCSAPVHALIDREVRSLSARRSSITPTRRNQPTGLLQGADRGGHCRTFPQPWQTPFPAHLPRVDRLCTAAQNCTGEHGGLPVDLRLCRLSENARQHRIEILVDQFERSIEGFDRYLTGLGCSIRTGRPPQQLKHERKAKGLARHFAE